MAVIELRFPTGRFHATPWGRHVNEGAVEWPPSPWRILRALIATWHLKAREEVPESILRELVHALAEEHPLYQLPPASLGHTRHYMPIIEGRNQKTTKVFDTFIHVAGPVLVKWATALSDEQGKALGILCERMAYFGRAESLVEVSVLPDGTAVRADARPLPANEPMPDAGELVRLLACENERAFQEWHAKMMAPAPGAESEPRAKPKRTLKKAAGSPIPADLFEALHAETGKLQTEGWTLPPGGRLADYVRREDCFDAAPAQPKVRLTRPSVARFAVASAVLPRITRAVSVAERVHQALVARFGDGPAPAVFTGLGADGKPREGHQHAFIFCEANGRRDSITHVTVFTRDGFDAPARRALESLQRVWGHGGHDLQLVLEGFGDTGTFADARIFAEAKVWRSLTPFVPTRHAKTYRDGRPKLDPEGWHIGSPKHDLRRLLVDANRPLPVKVRGIEEGLREVAVGSRRLRALEFQTHRYQGEGRMGHQAPCLFEVSFGELVRGPIAAGYGAHFGLGLFVPAEAATKSQ